MSGVLTRGNEFHSTPLPTDQQDKEVLKYTRETIHKASRMMATELGWISEKETS